MTISPHYSLNSKRHLQRHHRTNGGAPSQNSNDAEEASHNTTLGIRQASEQGKSAERPMFNGFTFRVVYE